MEVIIIAVGTAIVIVTAVYLYRRSEGGSSDRSTLNSGYRPPDRRVDTEYNGGGISGRPQPAGVRSVDDREERERDLQRHPLPAPDTVWPVVVDGTVSDPGRSDAPDEPEEEPASPPKNLGSAPDTASTLGSAREAREGDERVSKTEQFNYPEFRDSRPDPPPAPLPDPPAVDRSDTSPYVAGSE